jgi:hypothetical protein
MRKLFAVLAVVGLLCLFAAPAFAVSPGLVYPNDEQEGTLNDPNLRWEGDHPDGGGDDSDSDSDDGGDNGDGDCDDDNGSPGETR